jgi:hypothetical protein
MLVLVLVVLPAAGAAEVGALLSMANVLSPARFTVLSVSTVERMLMVESV